MPPPGPPRDSQSSIRTSQPTPIIVPNPNVKYSTVLRLPRSLGIALHYTSSAISHQPSAIRMCRHDSSATPVVRVAALRAARHLHAPAARRGSPRARRRDRRRAVRRRHVVPAGRASRAARDPFAVLAHPALQLFPEGRPVRSPERRRCRRHRRAAGEHREMLRRGRCRASARSPTRARGRSSSAATIRSRCRFSARWRGATDRSGWCSSTRTSTRGTSTSAASTFTGRRSAARSRRASSTARDSCRSAFAVRCTARTTSTFIASTGSR